MRSSGLAVVVLATTVGVVYGLVKVLGPESTRTAPVLLRNGKIAFVGSSHPDDRANSDIFAASPDGTEVIQVTDDPAPEYDPAWSPDGTKIAFAREGREGREGPSEVAATSIYATDVESGNVTLDRKSTRLNSSHSSPSRMPSSA